MRLAFIWGKHTSRWCGWHENDSKHTNRDTIRNANDNHYQYNFWLGVRFFMSLTSLIPSHYGHTHLKSCAFQMHNGLVMQ